MEKIMSKEKLTPKQEKFCNEYVVCGNASESYRQAYSTKKMKDEAIHVEAHKLLCNPKIALRVQELQDEIAKRNEVTQDKIVQELLKIIGLNIDDIVDDEGMPKPLSEVKKDIKNTVHIEYKSVGSGAFAKLVPVYKQSDRLKAMDILCKVMGYYKEDNQQQEVIVKIDY
jgi:phage terminase small subunit